MEGLIMPDFVKVAVDAMGGDNAPVEIVKGAIQAVNESNHVKVFLTGKEDVINQELAKYTYDKGRHRNRSVTNSRK